MRKILYSLVISFGLLFSFGQVAIAANPFSGACGIQNSGSSAVCSSDKSGTPIESTLSKVTKLVANVTGIAAILMIIIGGLMYVTSGGDANKVTNAKRTITFAVVGLLIAALARTLIVFVINRIG